MAALTDTWVNMHPYEHPYDAFFPNFGSYPGTASQAPTTHESSYAFHQASVEPAEMPSQRYHPSGGMTSYDPHPPISIHSYPHRGSYEENYHTLVTLPPESLNQVQIIDHRAHSPLTSVARTTDPLMTSVSQVSGPSVTSTSSSTLGSPNSAASRTLPRSDPWANSTFELGLGLVGGIVTTEDFTQETPITVGLGPESTFMDEKRPTGYVGKYATISSSTDAVQEGTLSSSSSSSPSLLPAFASHSNYSVGPPHSDLTVNTILEDIVGGVSASPTSATSTIKAPFGDGGAVFRSPGSPASVRPVRTHRSIDSIAARWHPYSHPTRRRSYSATPNASPSPRTHPVSSPNIPSPSVPQEAPNFHQSPFFAQSSGHFVAPLQSSSWFPSESCSEPSVPSLPLSYSLSSPSSGLAELQRLTAQPPVDPSLIQPFRSPTSQSPTPVLPVGEMSELQPPRLPAHHSISPEPSRSSLANYRRGSANIKAGSQTPYLHTRTYQPYPSSRRHSTSSRLSHTGSPITGSGESEGDESKTRGRCPHPDCGKVFRDLKSHILTHQAERPEKCPIQTCEYSHRGFARRYDRNRHTLTHYKGTMVCGFCPGSGSVAEKSFNRADVFKRHLMSVHHVEQTPPNSRKKSSAGVVSETKRSSSFPRDVTGKCSTCSETFNNAQDFYEHLDDCVLRVVQQEDPGEAINERHLASMDRDEAVIETFRGHALLTDAETIAPTPDMLALREAGEDNNERRAREEARLEPWPREPASYQSHFGHPRGVHSRPGDGNDIGRASAILTGGRTRGHVLQRGGIRGVIKSSKKRRKEYPTSWGCSPEQMRMKRRVFCVFDGSTRLCKDEMMLDRELEVRVSLGDSGAYVTDLDVETLKRVQAFEKTPEVTEAGWTLDRIGPQGPIS
ncbi:MAG: hypothetical protein M1816_003430 [Peltula sp. TS41687]|nr:MAG: hypothetical protein M1816_003430 [Peltula sp. TS41687]